MPASSRSLRVEDQVLPAIPTALVEVDVVRRWRDGVSTAVPIAAGEPGPDLTAAAEAFGLETTVLAGIGVSSAAGDVRTVPARDGEFGWTVGIGSGQPQQWRAAGGALARTIRERLGESAGEEEPDELGEASGLEYVQVRLPAGIAATDGAGGDGAGIDAGVIAALVLGLSLGDYRFRVTGQAPPPRLRKALLIVPDGVDPAPLRDAVARAREWAAATALTRDLANTPSNIKDPAWLTGIAARLAKGLPGLSAVVRDEKWLSERGFGGVLAVGGGSTSPPRLLEMSWRPEGADAGQDSGAGRIRHLVLVGKGITFDTGGISLKPADGMHEMRTDMAGGAAVIAAMLSAARLQLPIRVTAFVPAAENHVSGSSYRPGDVVRHYGGKTTEVSNTDAEGRLVLADAIAYAVRNENPDAVVDVATLTGATKIGLGLRTGGVFASDDDLARRVRDAGDEVGERWWRLPLSDDHADDVRGTLADVRQAASGPGGIMAALFLREFTSDLPWAHLDIAGPARADSPYAEVNSGATGFAARSLVELVNDLASD